jgi:signal transduction histidine kinase/DNA-binding response OmpR family regulator
MILIVDDKPENIISLKGLLTLHDFVVDTALSGEEALKKILKNTYSLIILDVQMPGMDGFEVAEAILGFSKAKDTPIIFLSAVSTEKRFITKGYTSGGIDYVTKPVDPDIMLLKVKTFYRLSEQNRELNKIQQNLKNEIEIRKETELRLDARVKELHSVMESLPLIAFAINAQGETEYVNEHWYRYSKTMDHFPEVHPDDEHICNEWKASFAAGHEYNCELRLRQLSSGMYRYFIMRIIPIVQEENIIKWVGTFTDIHEQKTINQFLEVKVKERTKNLVQKNEELETSNHELQQFAWVVSHDLKEPLRKIQTFNNIIKEKFIVPDSEGAKYLDRTIHSSERMSVLINDLLDYSRLSVSSLFQPTDLNEILNEVLSDFEYLITDKKAVIHCDTLCTIDAVPSQMRQIFQNLVSNALKFSREGVTPVISISCERVASKAIDSPAHEDGDYCRIVVSDNGIGFDEAHIDKLFIIFQRLHTRATYEGTGIGLAIAKKIVDKHNGLIAAKSKEYEGASFILLLPLKNSN